VIEKAAPNPGSNTWVLLFAVLAIATIINLAWTFREPLSQHPVTGAWISRIGWSHGEDTPTGRDISAFQLVSRDLHKHDQRAATLSLSVVFINRGEQALAYPPIDVTLVDAAGEPVAQRVFTPDEYMPQEKPARLTLEPGVHVPVLLEFADPGTRAIGFQLAFL
jgi:hypothetical protein